MNRVLALRTTCKTCIAVFVLAGAQLLTFGIPPSANAQSSTKPPAPGKTQKLANPLNEYLDEAQKSIDRNDFASAISPLEKFIAEKPDVAFAHFQLAYVYTALKRFAEARPELERAIAIDPKMPEAQLNLLGLAKSLEAQKKPEAAEAYKNYLGTQPADPGASSRMVRTLVDQQKYDEALAELDRADGGKPPTLDALRMRADVQIAQKKWSDAATTIRQAIALAPRDAELHGGLGRVYMQNRDFAAADKEPGLCCG